MPHTRTVVKRSVFLLLLGVSTIVVSVNQSYALSKECTALGLDVQADVFRDEAGSEATYEISFTKEPGSRGASASVTQGTSSGTPDNWTSVYELFSAKGLRHKYLKFGPVVKCTIAQDKVSITIKGEHYQTVQTTSTSTSRRKKSRPKSSRLEITCTLSAGTTCSSITTSVLRGGKQVSLMGVNQADQTLNYTARVILP